MRNHLLLTNFNSNPNIGLYGYCNDHYCLLSKEVHKKEVSEIEKVLKVPVHHITICGTNLIGAFLNGNNKVLLVPYIAFETELNALDKIGIKYKVIKTRFTSFGNNILCNDHGALVSSEYSADTKKSIRQALGVSLKPGTIGGLDSVGAAAAASKGHCVIHPDATHAEIKKIEELLKVKCAQATVNFGSPYLRSGILANSHGFVIGNLSTGVEINNIDRSFGFLNK